jgi:hypothetical protein
MFRRGRELLHERDEKMLAFDELWGARFSVVNAGGPPTDYVTLPHELSLFNKLSTLPGPAGQFVDVVPAGEQTNLLAFIHSSRGNHYYLGDRRMISFTQLEHDLFVPNGRFSTIGRFLLFRIEHPTPAVYLRIAASKTLMAPGHKTWSPDAVAEGISDVSLDFHGGGAANKIVGPIIPVMRGGHAYIALDLHELPSAFPIHRTGLAAFYHNWVPMDYRRMVAFARDISALSPEQRSALVRPRRISAFPADIAGATGLEFSGIYEDGWLSPEADIGLGRAEAGDWVRIKGQVPRFSATQSPGTVTIRVNGTQVWTLPADPGPFDWRLPIAHPGAQTDLLLQFSNQSILPNGDERPVSAKLELLEVAGEKDPLRPGVVQWGEAGQPQLPSEGIDRDGWASRKASFWLATPARANAATLLLEYPGWVGVPAECEISVKVDDEAPRAYRLKPGTNSIRIAFQAGPSARHIRISAATDLTLPSKDGRVRAFRLVSFSESSIP